MHSWLPTSCCCAVRGTTNCQRQDWQHTSFIRTAFCCLHCKAFHERLILGFCTCLSNKLLGALVFCDSVSILYVSTSDPLTFLKLPVPLFLEFDCDSFFTLHIIRGNAEKGLRFLYKLSIAVFFESVYFLESFLIVLGTLNYFQCVIYNAIGPLCLGIRNVIYSRVDFLLDLMSEGRNQFS